MDHTMIDVSGISEVEVGHTALLWGQSLGADEVAAAAETISYELLARVGPRVERHHNA